MSETRLEAAKNLFIRRWGEMAAGWGVSRTMAEIHALLYLTSRPLCADDVIEQLAVSRGSASTNLRELVNWGLIERTHQRGDRKEYFEAQKDLWEMFETIARERRRREVQPIVETIERCLEMVDEDRSAMTEQTRKQADGYRKRFADILDFCDGMNKMFNVLIQAARAGLAPVGPAEKTITKAAATRSARAGQG